MIALTFAHFKHQKIKYILKYSILIFLVFTGFTAMSQEKIQVQATVRSVEDSTAIPNVHIISYQEASGTVSNGAGQFRYELQEDDSLLFSVIGFQRYTATYDELKQYEGQHISIYLVPKIYRFRTTYVYPKKGVPKEKIEIEGEYDNFLIEGEQNKIDFSGGQISGIFSALYEKYSREGRERRKLLQQMKDEAFKNYLSTSYRRTIVEEVTGLNDKEIDRFLGFCDFSSFAGKDLNYYELVHVIRQCYRVYYYQKRRVPEPEELD